MVVRRSPKPLTGVRSPLPLLIKDLDFQGPFLLLYMFSFSYRKSDFLFNHIFSCALFSLLIAFLVAFYFLFNRIFSCVFFHAQLNSIKYYNCGQAGDSTHTASGIRHPFLTFFIFGMPGHLIISWICAKSGILFWIFSFFACRGTRS